MKLAVITKFFGSGGEEGGGGALPGTNKVEEAYEERSSLSLPCQRAHFIKVTGWGSPRLPSAPLGSPRLSCPQSKEEQSSVALGADTEAAA